MTPVASALQLVEVMLGMLASRADYSLDCSSRGAAVFSRSPAASRAHAPPSTPSRGGVRAPLPRRSGLGAERQGTGEGAARMGDAGAHSLTPPAPFGTITPAGARATRRVPAARRPDP